MASAPSAVATGVFACPRASIVISDNYVSIKNLHMAWGHTLIQESVIGSHDPIVGTGEFRGTIDFEYIAYSENQFHDFASPVSGQIASKTFTITETDYAGTPRAWTVVCKLNNYEETFREAEFVRVRCSGILTTEPSEVT